MCGIFGCVGDDGAIKKTIQGLEKLEYRGYDSSGIAYINKDGKLNIKKRVGKIKFLKDSLNLDEKSSIAIAHTRWATHGVPNIKNSHPHRGGDFVIVHNGIIENYIDLKKELEDNRIKFCSDTDTEIIAKLLDYNFKQTYKVKDNKEEINRKILESIKKTVSKLSGAWAVAFINKKNPETIYGFKKGSPLTLSFNGDSAYISSDLNAIEYKDLKSEKSFVLNDGEIVELSKDNAIFYDANLYQVGLEEVKLKRIKCEDFLNYEHYMLKEILEIPLAVEQTYKEFKNKLKIKFFQNFNYDNITIIGCGTAYHAGLYGKYIFEKLLRKRVNVELASEFRYREPIFSKNDLVIAISQSGETADTIAGIKMAREKGATTAVITNVQISTITDYCDYVFLTMAGAEIAVAATKSYVTQMFSLYLIANYTLKNYDIPVDKLIRKLKETLNEYNRKECYQKYLENKKFFFIGRLSDSNTASEGALKLKEIAYVHSEGYPAGELKHGTLSLVDDNSLIIAIITQRNIKEKTLNSVHETVSRGAKTLLVSQFEDLNVKNIILLPHMEEELMPLISIIPLQLLAYYMAVSKGLDPDKPRNLAKSVTVE